MKIAVLSDLHLEFADYDEPLPEADVLVLAGDISTPNHFFRWCEFVAKCNSHYEHVIEIDGNHTAYGGSIEDFDHSQVKEKIGDVTFIAATLWSGPDSKDAYRFINDGSAIHGFTWDWMLNRHEKDLAFIERSLKDSSGKTVVVTHHMPSKQCVDDKYKSPQFETVNKAFYADLDWLIDKYRPDVWICGHTHSSFDKLHTNGKTRLVCNPRGYCRFGMKENGNFNPRKTIEL